MTKISASDVVKTNIEKTKVAQPEMLNVINAGKRDIMVHSI